MLDEIAIFKELAKLKIQTNHKGYQYIFRAIQIYADEPESRYQFLNKIYGKIAQEHDTNIFAVERCIKRSIDISISELGPEKSKEYFGFNIDPSKKNSITSSKWISFVAMKLLVEHNQVKSY